MTRSLGRKFNLSPNHLPSDYRQRRSRFIQYPNGRIGRKPLLSRLLEIRNSPPIVTPTISGLHHVTAIAGDPQRNLDFYAGVLGLRLVKRTVNFDDPGTYHFYFGDAMGSPGTILTFFPWAGVPRGTRGTGEVQATSFAVPASSVSFWIDRLRASHVAAERATERFGEEVVRFADPDGMGLELIATTPLPKVAPWDKSGIPEEFAIRGLHSVTGALEGYERTAALLTDVLGYRLHSQDQNRFRFAIGDGKDPGQILDLLCTPDNHRGRSGAGSVHHIAFRAPDDVQQLAWRERLVDLGYNVSPVMDRDYFHSIYFREPGGILFEIATDPPGFALDESIDELGRNLKLPKWAESQRDRLLQILPVITVPHV